MSSARQPSLSRPAQAAAILRSLPGLAERLRSRLPPHRVEDLHELWERLSALRPLIQDSTAAPALLSNAAARSALLGMLAVALRQPLPFGEPGSGGGTAGAELSWAYHKVAKVACLCCGDLMLCNLPRLLAARRVGFALRRLRTQPLQCCARRLAAVGAALLSLERGGEGPQQGPQEQPRRGPASSKAARAQLARADCPAAEDARTAIGQSIFMTQGLTFVAAHPDGEEAELARLRQELAAALRDSCVLEHAARTLLLLLGSRFQHADEYGDDCQNVLGLLGILHRTAERLLSFAIAAPATSEHVALAAALRGVLSGRCVSTRCCGGRVAPPGRHGALALLLRVGRLAVASGRSHLAAGRDVSHVLWSLAVLNVRPGLPLLQRLVSRALAVRRNQTPQCLVMSLWGLSRLRVALPEPAVALLLRSGMGAAALAPGGRAGPGDLAGAALVLARCRHVPHRRWLARFYGAVARQVDGFRPGELCNLLYGMSALGLRPEPRWLDRVLAAVERHAAGASGTTVAAATATGAAPAEVAGVAGGGAGMAIVGARPSDSSSGDGGASSLGGGRSGSNSSARPASGSWGSGAASITGGGGEYGEAVRDATPSHLRAAAVRPPRSESGWGLLAAAQAQAQGQPFPGLGRLGQPMAHGSPRAQQHRTFDGAAAQEAGAFGPVQLATVLWAVARLGHVPAEAWLASMARAVADRAQEFGPQEAAAVITAVNSLAPKKWRRPASRRHIGRGGSSVGSGGGTGKQLPSGGAGALAVYGGGSGGSMYGGSHSGGNGGGSSSSCSCQEAVGGLVARLAGSLPERTLYGTLRALSLVQGMSYATVADQLLVEVYGVKSLQLLQPYKRGSRTLAAAPLGGRDGCVERGGSDWGGSLRL
ncbi:hypothetical protein TSOC_011713 [Tetrabaena socialis]|uniref:Uncharacterized protein n=1 Tax=Tetrabaena socialis TaxID=47790 RepID=A0A2J7ZPX6_9CHLO|nr:hypothetical protein TSOC_011713 [Tetrabaena socialis]|eukprot:PNH02320.1 hypothetical protein TSOC_011713 [Tetrabaena socialis]